MSPVVALATLFLALTIVLGGGTILRYVLCSPYGASRVAEIRRLRQDGLAVNQEGEA